MADGLTSSPRVADAILRICADPEGDHRAVLLPLDAEEWRELAHRADGWRLAPLVERARVRAGMAGDDEAAAVLGPATRWHRLHTLQQAAALAHLAEVAAARGLDPVALKGASLAYCAYPDPVLRPMRDIDLLLPAADAAALQRALLADPRYRIYPQVRGTRRAPPDHFVPLQDAQLEVTFEIHHRIGDPATFPCGDALAAALLAAPARIAVGQRELAVAPPEANALHLVSAAVLKDRLGGGPMVLADLAYLAHAGLDWDRAWHLAGELGLRRPLALCAAVAERHGARWLPPVLTEPASAAQDYLEAAARAMVAPPTAGSHRRILERVRRAGPGLTGAARLALSPEPMQLAKIARVDPSSRWRWLGYPAWLVGRSAEFLTARRNERQGTPADARLADWLNHSGARS